MTGELDPLRDLVRELNEQAFPDPPDIHLPTGGSKNVTHSIGRDHTCWCGRPDNHDWTGREDGAPHPRYPE